MSERLRVLNDRIADHLVRMDVDPDRNGEGFYLIRYGSTAVVISVFEDKERTYVRFASTVLANATPSLDLVTRVLRLNTEVLFGAFLLFEDDTLSFTHTLMGDDLDFASFSHTLTYVAQVSDDHDEALQAIAGGLRVEDILSE